MKTLIFDIETSPILGYAWKAWQTNIIEVHTDWQMICFAYKWMGQKKVHFVRGEDDDPWNDDRMVKRLWDLFNEADTIVGHNLDRFDVKKSNALFMRKGLTRPAPFKTVDTLKVARKNFHNTSNRLGELAKLLGLDEGKLEHQGFMHLFKGCMLHNDPKVWRVMKRYNLRDVTLTEDVYKRLLSWMPTTHPVDLDKPNSCIRCGSDNIRRKGWRETRKYRYKRYRCNDCGSWMRSNAKEINKKPIYTACP